MQVGDLSSFFPVLGEVKFADVVLTDLDVVFQYHESQTPGK